MVLFTLAWHDKPARNPDKRPPTDPKVPKRPGRKIMKPISGHKCNEFSIIDKTDIRTFGIPSQFETLTKRDIPL